MNLLNEAGTATHSMRFRCVMTHKHPAHAVEKAAEQLRTAQELTDRQRDLVAKFESEGLDASAERNLLSTFQNVLALEEVRMGRLLYEDVLLHGHNKKRSRP